MNRWTIDQQAAIEAQVGPVLVSAAAGSGKTAVLVERVLRRLTDPVHPIDLDSFLLVTFTNAAASEMRAKLGTAMSDRLAAEPNNARLRRQARLSLSTGCRQAPAAGFSAGAVQSLSRFQ